MLDTPANYKGGSIGEWKEHKLWNQKLLFKSAST